MKTKKDYQELLEAIQEEIYLNYLFKGKTKGIDVLMRLNILNGIKSKFTDYEISMISEFIKEKPNKTLITEYAKKHKARMKKEREDSTKKHDTALEDELFLFLIILISTSKNDFETIVMISLLRSFLNEDRQHKANYNNNKGDC